MERIKIGAAVVASTTTSNHGAKFGKLVKRHKTEKGDWLEIKPTDGGKNFKTRQTFVKLV